MTWQQRYLLHFYDRSRGWVDGTTEFWDLCRRHVPSGSRILEVGAGPSNQTSRFLSTLGQLDGVDVDLEVMANDSLRVAALIVGGRFPVFDGEYDACVSDYVIEHIFDPTTHLLEVKRALKPGGFYVFRTPNRFHYVAIAARATPHWVHRLVANRLRRLTSDPHDPYATKYALNSRRAIRRLAVRCGFEVTFFRMIEKEPSYGMSSRVLFLAFTAYERFVNSTEAAAGLRANILGVLRKPS